MHINFVSKEEDEKLKKYGNEKLRRLEIEKISMKLNFLTS